MEHGVAVANHLFNQKCRVDYPNRNCVAGNNFQKTEINYNETLNWHAYFRCECDNIKNVVEVSLYAPEVYA